MRLFAIAALMLSLSATSVAAPVVFEASGSEPADIQAAVDGFRAFLGDNNGVGGTFPDGRREINWDGVPDAFSAPNNLPANFFNANSPRGAVFFTPGTGFQVSTDSDNPTNTPIEFGNIKRFFPRIFRTFSPERLFTALDSNITEQLFFVPGTSTPATVDGFGAVFTDVDRNNITKIEYFDVNGSLLFSRFVLPETTPRESLSFLGVGFDAGERVFLVRITSGNVRLSPTKGILPVPSKGIDTVVMDDFIYGEPQPQPNSEAKARNSSRATSSMAARLSLDPVNCRDDGAIRVWVEYYPYSYCYSGLGSRRINLTQVNSVESRTWTVTVLWKPPGGAWTHTGLRSNETLWTQGGIVDTISVP